MRSAAWRDAGNIDGHGRIGAVANARAEDEFEVPHAIVEWRCDERERSGIA